MKLLIIGATRGIGRRLLEQALAEGHQVTVLVRSLRRLGLSHERLTVVEGDILDPQAVARAVAGQDGVCVTIGVKAALKPVTVFSRGTENVVAAMKEFSVRTLVCVTGIGAGESKNHGGFLYDRIFKPLLLRRIYADKDRQEEIIRRSGLEWVIVRPGFLTNGPLTGKYRVLTELKGIKARKISRADVAHFILRELQERRYLGKAPLLTY